MLVALENGLFVFVEGKLEKPEKNPQSTAKTNNKLNPRVWAGIESRPHWWKGSTLITAPWQLASRPFPISLCLCFKASLSANHSYENDFDLRENETAC